MAIMNFEGFKANILEMLRDFYGNDAEVQIKKVTKNNNIKLDGVQISFKDDRRICPVIYLNRMYEDYMNGDIDMLDVIDKIIQVRGNCDNDLNMDIIGKLGILTDWEMASEAVFPALVKTENNAEMLEQLVSRAFLDLSIIYILRFTNEANGTNASVKITRDMMHNYGITESELYEAAIHNLRNKDKPEIELMYDVLMRLCDIPVDFNAQDTMNSMLVLTSRSGANGACQMLNMHLLDGTYSGRSFYIIPSSINELILLDDKEDMDVEAINAMIREVNSSQLSPEEVLSDHVYYYDATSAQVKMCA